ncbi:MAG: alpha-2-macroglobulin family protein [Gammaproteobacteria bacterium]|nr:alpha-2-macroglobulin family protein [Gammaproteobacteria bacterium]
MHLFKWLGLIVCLWLVTSCEQPSESPSVEPKSQTLVQERPQYQSPTIADAQRQQLSEEFSATPFKVLNISEQIYDGGPALAVIFSVPIDPQLNVTRYLELSTEDGKPVTGEWVLNDSLNIAYFPFVEAQTRYQIKVHKGLPAINGRLLERDETRTVRTAASQQQIRFISHGAQLSMALSDGLSVEAINVAAVDIDFHRVNDEQMSLFLGDYLGDDYYELRRLQQYATLSYSARYDLNYTPNRRRSSLISIKNIKPLQQPGVYIAVMKGAGDYPYRYQVTWFTISDLGLQVRSIGQSQLAFVNNAINAQPESDVEIRILNRKGQVLAQQKTSKQGFAELNGVPLAGVGVDQRAFAVVAQKGAHLSVLKLAKPAMDLTEYGLIARPQRALEMFLYGPRELYRPGETVTVRGLLRDNDGRLIQPQPIQVTIKRPDGRTFQSFVWQGDEQSFYQHEFSLPKTTLTGQWRLNAKLGNGDHFDYDFQVEDFLPERMKLALNPVQSQLSPNETAEINIQGDYLYGAPAANNRVEADITVRQARSLSQQYPDYIFGIEDFRDFDIDKPLTPLKLDSLGQAKLTLPNLWQKTQQPLKLSTRVSLFESGGRPVTRSVQQVVWPRSQMLGVKPVWDGAVTEPNATAQFEIININQAEELVASKKILATLVRENANYYWQWNDGWSYQQSVRNIPVFSKTFALEKGERMSLALPVEYGNYRLELRDPSNQLLNSYRFFAGWRWDRADADVTGRPDMVKLAWNQNHFAANEQAELNIEAPYAGTAIVTVEADNLLWRQSVELKQPQGKVSIPIAANWQRHDIYATVTVIRQGEAKNKRLPKRAFGLLHLPLDRESRKLAVTLDVPEKILPESTLTTKVKVTGASGSTVNVTLAAVDVGVLSLHRHVTPKPDQWFFAQRRFQTELRDTWGSFIEQLSDKAARQRFGGDADVELSRGGDAPISDVQVVSLVSEKVQLNDAGEAIIELPVPYFNGELKLMAVAFNHSQFGHQDARVKVAAPLVAEISMPRFLGAGDQSLATLDLQNMTDQDQQLALTLRATSELGGEVITDTVTLAPKQKETFMVALTGAQATGSGQVEVSVKEQGNSAPEAINLTRSWRLGLRSPFAAEMRQWDAVLTPKQTLLLPQDLTAGLQVPGQHLLLTASDSPPFNAADHLNHLFSYPYGCLEQTTSRAWPILLASQAELLRYDNSKDKVLANQRSSVINKAISRIISMQRSDGSFGLWGNQSDENHWLSVYATDFLLTAQDQGYSVDQAVLERALKRLQRYLTTSRKMWSENRHYSSDPDHYHISYRAYAAYVLARKQQARLSDIRNLYDRYHALAKSRLPYAFLARALELAGDAKRSEQAWAKALSAEKRQIEYSGDYGSAVRDQGLATLLALQSNAVSDPWTLVFQLRDDLLERRWLSTQERVTLFRLAQSFSDRKGEQWTLNVTVDEAKETVTSTGDWTKHWAASAIPNQTQLASTFSKPLYVSARVQGYPEQAPKATSDGIRVKRAFYNERGEKLNLAAVNSGDLVLVRLDVQSTGENRIPDALLVDLLPAGLELENQNLESAVKMDEMVVAGKSVAQWMSNVAVNHQEYRDDRFVAALPIQLRQDATIFYLARAVTPGTYIIPPTQVEDMYRPYLRAIGDAQGTIKIAPK